METTKRTTASVRIALSHAYSTFEVAVNLDNPDGISLTDIEAARKDAQSLATAAVNEFKATPNPDLKVAIRNVENTIKQIKDMATNTKPEQHVDPKEIEAIEKLPLYEPKVKAGKSKAKK